VVRLLNDDALPSLREELRLLPATPQPDGSPAWHVLDPIRNRFYRIGWLELELLSRWDLGAPEAIARAVSAETTLVATGDDVAALADFLARNELAQPAGPAPARALAERAERQRGPWWRRLVHQYLFFRVPLAYPRAWLERLAHRLSWAWSPAFLGLSFAAGLVGLWLAARQWDVVVAQTAGAFEGLAPLGFVAALAVAKTLHELGHAVTATRLGVRVGHMGVAFVVMLPMLYTDTGESWKLLRSRARLRIAAAGLVTELLLAAWATLAWALLPDGALRQAMLFLATTSWVLSFAINASPFMRFDGYFLLADALDLPNLHERAGAIAKARLRGSLLGLPQPDPEPFTAAAARWLAAFAVLTWAYRALVFFGIALAVYHIFFKALGVVLFAVEIHWFILRPIGQELRAWWQARSEISPRRRLVMLAAVVGAAAFVLVPWQTRVSADGWIYAVRQTAVHATQPARVEAVHVRAGDRVAEGQPLFDLAAPVLEDAERRASLLADAYARQASGLAGADKDGAARAQLARQLEAEWRREAEAQRQAVTRLRLTAPFAGVVRDVDRELRPGSWVGVDAPLAWVVDPTSWRAEVLVEEAAVARLAVGQTARLYPVGYASAPWRARVAAVDPVRLHALPHPMLDARHGGPVVTEAGEGQSVSRPRAALFRVVLELDAPPAVERMHRVRAAVEAAPQSLWDRWSGAAVATLVRESGF
jgi:putative peptide zinc metalloprotease protein